MTKPVAYMWKTVGGNVLGFQEYKENTPYPGYATPLYTEEQLHPCVKMTQEQWNEFNTIRNNSITFSDFWTQVFKQGMVRQSISKLSERDLMTAWLDDENVEIVSNMKWFVRSKESDKDGYYWWLTHTGSNFVPEYMPNKNASSLINSFDTKEQAEKWTNPLTEAVQLPVDGE